MNGKRNHRSDTALTKANGKQPSHANSDNEDSTKLLSTKQHVTNSETPAAKRHKPNEIEKLPTSQEQIYLNETNMLYHSHLFRVKMDEMLKNISMKHKHKLLLEGWLKKFQKFLSEIPSADTPVDLQDWSPYSEVGVAVPLAALPRVSGHFQFAPPTSVNFTGSFTTNTVTSLGLVLDVIIEMPRECFRKQDCRDGRWLLKRVHYLGHLATALKRCPLVQQEETSWTQHLGEPLRPALLLSPNLTGGISKWKVQLLPVPSEGTFKCHTFSPQKINVKNKGELPCPSINFLCAVDAEMALHSSALQTALQSLPGLVQGIKLAKVWLNQRQLNKGRGALSGYVLSQLVLHLCRTGRIFAHSSDYQVFKILLVYLDESNWTESGINIFDECQKGKDIKDNPFANTLIDTTAYHNLYPVVVVGPSGYCNLTAALTPQYCKQLKQEANHGLKILSSKEHTFDLLFIQRSSFDLSFDQSIHIKIKKNVLQHYYSPEKASTKPLLLDQLHPAVVGESPSSDSGVESNEDDQDEKIASVGDLSPLIPELGTLLERGLGPRATLVAPKLVPAPVWHVGKPVPAAPTTVTFGLRVDPSCAWNLLIKDQGTDPAEFREFWGERSILRRYRDGTNCESVAWGDGSEGEGDCRTIPGQIAQHLFHRHFQIPRNDVYLVGPKLETLLRLPDEFEGSKEYCTGESSCVAAVQAYGALCQLLRSFDATDMVLKVANIVSSDPALAHAAVYPRRHIDPTLTAVDQIRKATELCDPILVLVFMERSGKWPNDLEAVEQVRTSLHAAILKQLRKKRVPALCQTGRMLVVMEGYAFHVRVTYQGEVLLLRQQIAPEWQGAEEEQLCQYDTKASLQLQVDTTITPLIVSALAGLGGLHPSYGSAVRLCRRWLSCSLMEPHMPPLATQLLVAHLYTSPGQFQPPHTPHVAFLRFLTLLATTRFEDTPFFINLNDKFRADDLEELENKFNSNVGRELLPHLFLATPFDIRGGDAKLKEAGGVQGLDDAEKVFRYKLVSHCTQERPLQVIVGFVKRLAVAALDIYQSMIYKPKFNPLAFCKPMRFMFNIVVELDPNRRPCLEENLNYSRLKPKDVHSTVGSGKVVKKQPLKVTREYVRDMVTFLQEKYKEYALVHHDPLGGDIITFSFMPGALDEMDMPKVVLGTEYELLTSNPPLRVRLDPHLLAFQIPEKIGSIVKSVTVNVSK